MLATAPAMGMTMVMVTEKIMVMVMEMGIEEKEQAKTTVTAMVMSMAMRRVMDGKHLSTCKAASASRRWRKSSIFTDTFKNARNKPGLERCKRMGRTTTQQL